MVLVDHQFQNFLDLLFGLVPLMVLGDLVVLPVLVYRPLQMVLVGLMDPLVLLDLAILVLQMIHQILVALAHQTHL